MNATRYLLTRSLFNKNFLNPSRSYHGGHHKAPTMNDLPVPQGDWQENYARKNSRYNLVLAAGIIMLASTIGLVKSTGIIHFNFSPPKNLD